jgi:ComF family protein
MVLPSRLLGALLDLLAPRTCGACDEPLRAHQVAFCDPCLEQLEPPVDTATDSTFSCFRFAGPVKDAVHRVKFQCRSDIAARLGLLFGNVAGEELDLPMSSSWWIVPVPLSPTRLAARGFNQAAELARGLGRGLGARVVHGLVQRVRSTLPQASLGRRERAANVEGAFSVRSARAVAGRRILVVDDVVTTGETLGAMQAALRDAGAAEVRAAALARAGRDLEDRGSPATTGEKRNGPRPA